MDPLETRQLISQSVNTKCDGCTLTKRTCILTGACRHTACMSWQEWSLNQHIFLYANRTYAFRLNSWRSVDRGDHVVPYLGVSPFTSNHGGLSSLPINYNQPRAAQLAQFTFRTFMASGSENHIPVIPATSAHIVTASNADKSPHDATLSSTAIALISVIVFIVGAAAGIVLSIRRNIAVSKIGTFSSDASLPRHSDSLNKVFGQESKVAWPSSITSRASPIPVLQIHRQGM